MTHVLIVDENRKYCDKLREVMGKRGFSISSAHTLREGFRIGRERDIDVVLLTSPLSDGCCGIDNVQRFRSGRNYPEVIVLAANANASEAETAISNGAWDYVLKSPSPYKLVEPLSRLAHYRAGKKQEKEKGDAAYRFPGIIGSNSRFRMCLDLLAKASQSNANVLVQGETGTGKELFAVALHHKSQRVRKNFVVVDCAALPETLVESTLFGHERGSFTGANRSQTGLVKQADGGTLFLDEVGEMPLSLQKTFLRVIEERRFRPVGGEREITSDFRLVAATNRDLDAMVAEGRFRSDLLFRLRTFSIQLPSLQERESDLKELTSFFISRLCQQNSEPEKIISRDFLKALASYPWPGNVRELAHALERSLAVAQGETMLMATHLPTYIRVHNVKTALGEWGGEPGSEVEEESSPESGTQEVPLEKLQVVRDRALAKAEKEYLHRLFNASGGKIQEACLISGLSRSRLYQLLKDHGVRLSRDF